MIIKEFLEIRYDGIKLFRTFSTENYKIKKIGTNEIYDEAIDVESSNYTYEETQDKIEIIEEIIESE